MVGEEYGWYALDGLSILWIILQTLIVIAIPGFLLSLAIFPKRAALALSERLALSVGLGLVPPFLLSLLNISLNVRVDYVTSLLVFILVTILSLLLFINRGGDLNLVEWYNTKEALSSE